MLDIVYNRQDRELVSSIRGTAPRATLNLVLRDVYNLSIAVVKPNYGAIRNPWDVQELVSESVIMAARATIDSAEYLIYNEQFIWNGQSGGISGAARYEGQLNLNSQELIDAVEAAPNDTLSLVGEITIQDASNYHRDTTQFTITVQQDVIRDDGAIPPAALDGSPAIRFVTKPDGNEGVQIYNRNGILLVEFLEQ